MSRLRNTVIASGLVVAVVVPTAGTVQAEATAPARTGGPVIEHPPARRSVPGLVQVRSRFDFEQTWSNLIGALEANPNIGIVATVDHAAAAEANGLDLEPNRVVVFGNPNLGTPLMQAGQTVGIDLPQKMHVTERRGVVTVSYNAPASLVARHGLGDVATVDTITGALASFAEAAAGRTPREPRHRFRWHRGFDGLETTESDADFETTWNRLIGAIEASPAAVAFTVDHGANAAANGFELRPTRLVVFGNPNLGTPLMQSRRSAGIDLPLKILVWEDADGTVQVTTNTTAYLAVRHRIFRPRSVFDTLRAIDGALADFVAAATTT